MRKIILLYSLALAALIWIMKVLDYRFLVRDITVEMYLTAVGILCTGLGIWMGWRYTQSQAKKKLDALKAAVAEQAIPPSLPSAPLPAPELRQEKMRDLGISDREYDVLLGLARGLSNQEIADELFISLNTVKTHLSKLYGKLEVKRRTQAVESARQLGLIPLTQKDDIGAISSNHPKG